MQLARKMNESKESERERKSKRERERKEIKKNPRLVFKLYIYPGTFCFLSQVISNTIIHIYNTVYYYFGLNKIWRSKKNLTLQFYVFIYKMPKTAKFTVSF
jgi:hypothetical protein